jgi:hypothetical protein
MKTTIFLLHAAAAISLVAASNGCGGPRGGTGGGSSSATSSNGTTGTGGSRVPAAQAAWSVTTDQPDGAACALPAGTDALGQVTASTMSALVADGMNGATISCSVLGNGPFEVDGAAASASAGLQITVPAISAGATQAAPAAGTISLLPSGSTSLYTGSCSFYFVPDTPEIVASGKVWVAFTCPGIGNSIAMSTCPVTESYALFEGCVSGP